MQKLSLVLIAASLWGCGSGDKPETKIMNNSIQDVHSFSRPEQAVMKHLSLDLAVNFEAKTLSGSATIDIENKSGTDTLMLDVRDLTITEVSIDGEKTTYEIGLLS